jgi:hypothetical protein
MKKALFSAVALTTIVGSVFFLGEPPASADDDACGLRLIDLGIDGAIVEIKGSPAIGHAGGHYGRAIRDLEATKRQLHEGCADWEKGGKKPNRCEKVQRPDMISPAHKDCKIEAIEVGLNGVMTAIEGSPACGHAAGHYGKAIRDLYKTEKQLREGCDAWNKGGRK